MLRGMLGAMLRGWLLVALFWGSAWAQTPWQRAEDGFFIVYTAAEADAHPLPQVFAILQQARRDLGRHWQLPLSAEVSLYIHPNLDSFTHTTGLPWYVAGVADRRTQRIDVQRLRVLLERHSLQATLRHELFHLAQPEDWPRWRAEGSAMIFAGERPRAEPLPDLSDAELDALLAEAMQMQLLERAAATAYWRTRAYLRAQP